MDEGKQQTGSEGGGTWQFKPESKKAPAPAGAPPAAPKSTNTGSVVEWTASEYVAHHKGPGWYTALVIVAAAITALLYLFTRDIVSSVIVLVVAVLFGVAAGRKPRVLTYRLDDNGLTIGQKLYPYTDFKSYTLTHDTAFASITLMPLKRFMPSLSIYFAPEDEEKIVQALSARLPFEQHKTEAVDRLMHRIRF